MWTNAIEPIRALTADSIEKYLESPAQVAKIFSVKNYSSLLHVQKLKLF